MPDLDLLRAYANIAVKVGIGLQSGDRLLIQSSIEALEFTRVIVEQAYAAGAENVDVLWSDEDVDRARFLHGTDAATATIATRSMMRLAALDAGDLMLYVDASDPDAYAGIDPQRIAGYTKKNRAFLEPLSIAQMTLKRGWSVVAAPTPAWAEKVFPEESPSDALELLWSAIFRACRADHDDPVAAWARHLDDLASRRLHLTSRGYTGLRYEGPGTDLTLGLPDGAVWMGGNAGSPFVPNLPTEEVFAAPHRLIGEGTVTASKPLSLFGHLVEGFSFEVSAGEIVDFQADRGNDVLAELIATDEGSMRFGEVAMVPMSSAVAAEGLIWSNTLYDENDGCHIAIGRSYPICIEGGTEMSTEQLEAAGMNISSTHVDFVVGSPDLNVFGVTQNGSEEPIILGGEWGFST